MSFETRVFPFGGLLTAASRSSPVISSASERPPSENTEISGSPAFDLAEPCTPRLTTLMLSVRTEGADEWLDLFVSDGAVDLGRPEEVVVTQLGASEVGPASLGIEAAQLSISESITTGRLRFLFFSR